MTMAIRSDDLRALATLIDCRCRVERDRDLVLCTDPDPERRELHLVSVVKLAIQSPPRRLPLPDPSEIILSLSLRHKCLSRTRSPVRDPTPLSRVYRPLAAILVDHPAMISNLVN